MKRRLLLVVAALVLCFSMVTFAACTPHEHTFSQEWSKDADYHWHAATCEHTTEVSAKEAHKWGEGQITTQPTEKEAGVKTFTCTVCGQTKTEPVKATGVHVFGEPTYTWSADNKTCTAERKCTTAGCTGKETETVNASATKTQEATPLQPELTNFEATFTNTAFAKQTKTGVETAPVIRGVSVAEAKAKADTDELVWVRAIVIGKTGNYDGGYVWMILKDVATDEICLVRKNADKEGGEILICGGSSAAPEMYFELGDEIVLPVKVSVSTAEKGGEVGKVLFRYQGESFTDDADKAALVAKYKVGHVDNYALDKSQATVIDSQADLTTFLTTPGFQYKLVVLKGAHGSPLKMINYASAENRNTPERFYYRFFFEATSLDEQKVGGASPVFSNFGNTFNLSELFGKKLFGQTAYISSQNYTNPYEYYGDLYAVVIGGSTAYHHFIVLDEASIQQTKVNHNFSVWNHTETQHWKSCSVCGKSEAKVNHVWKDGECICGVKAAQLTIGDQVSYYKTLAEAVAAVPATNVPAEIKLLTNLSGDGVKVQAGQNIVFNFNGKTYEMNGQTVGSVGTETNGFQLLKGSEVTMKNGTIEQSLHGCKIMIQNYTNLVLEDMTLDARTPEGATSGTWICMYVLSNNFGNTVIKGATNIIAAEGQAAFDLWFGLNAAGLYDEGVTVTFDESFTGTVEGIVEYGAETAAVGRVPNWKERTVLTINGNGTFNVTLRSGNTASITDLSEANIVRNGGVFNMVSVTREGSVSYFQTLPEAVAAIPADGVLTEVKLLNDLSGDGVKVQAGQNIVFNFNGKTYEMNGQTVGSVGTETNGFQLLKGSEVTMKNGTIEQSLHGCKIMIQNYTNLVLEDMTLDARTPEGATSGTWICMYVLSNNFGNTVIKGATNIIAAEGQAAFDLWFGLNAAGLYDEGVTVTFDESFTGTVSGRVEYGATTAGAGRVSNWKERTVLTINGSGTFNITLVSGNTASISDLSEANIVVKGGKFPFSVAGYVPAGYEETQVGGQYVVAKTAA